MSISDAATLIVDCHTHASESAALARLLEYLVAEQPGRLRLHRVNVDVERAWWPAGNAAGAPRLALFRDGKLIDVAGSAADVAPADEFVTAFVHRGLESIDDDCAGGACLL